MSKRRTGYHALEPKEMYAARYAADCAAMQVFAQRARELGYPLVKTTDAIELAAIPRERILLFSDGLKAVNQQLSDRGIDPSEATRTQAQLSNFISRGDKAGYSVEDLAPSWLERNAEAGFKTLSPEELKAPIVELQAPLPLEEQVSKSLSALFDEGAVIRSANDLLVHVIRDSDYQIGYPEIQKELQVRLARGDLLALEDGRLVTPETARHLGLTQDGLDVHANAELQDSLAQNPEGTLAQLKDQGFDLTPEDFQDALLNGEALVIAGSETDRRQVNLQTHDALVDRSDSEVLSVRAWDPLEGSPVCIGDVLHVDRRFPGTRKGEWLTVFAIGPSMGPNAGGITAVRKQGDLVNLDEKTLKTCVTRGDPVRLEVVPGEILRLTATMPSLAVRRGERVEVIELGDGKVTLATLDGTGRTFALSLGGGALPLDYGYAVTPGCGPVGPSASLELAIALIPESGALSRECVELAARCGSRVQVAEVGDIEHAMSVEHSLEPELEVSR